jgi:hypothetical protein
MSDDDQEFLLSQFIARLPTGRAHVISANDFAWDMGISKRKVGQLAERAIMERGYAVGSLCGEDHGYFLIAPNDREDLEQGVAHSMKRAVAILTRVRALRRNYMAMPGALQTTIFDEIEEIPREA